LRKEDRHQAEQTIAFAQGIEMPPDILAQVQQLKPAGFTLQMLPPLKADSGYHKMSPT
jgi:hypothetical protein